MTRPAAAIAAERYFEHAALERGADFQRRADDVFAACNLGDAPRRRPGDSSFMHQTQVVDELLTGLANLPHFSQRWKGLDARRLGTEAGPVVDQIFNDAVAAYQAPTGPLRETVEHGHGGQEVHRFYGDPEACWAPFKRTPRVIAKWDTDCFRGRNAVGAIVPVQHILSDGTVVPAR